MVHRRLESLTIRALRHRPGQAIAFVLLSLLGVAACAFGPFYERAVEAAQLRSTLSSVPVADRGLSVRAGTAGSVDPLLPSGRLRDFYEPPVRSTTLSVSFPNPDGSIDSVVGSMVHRDGQCGHLRMVAGACPTRAEAVAVSASTAAYFHLSVGSRIPILSVGTSDGPLRPLTLTVAGLYAPFDSEDAYWFGRPYSTAAGVIQIGGTNSGELVADAFFARSSFPRDLAPMLPPSAKASVYESADLPLRVDRVGLDDEAAIRHGLTALAARDAALSGGTQVQTLLQPYLLDQVDHGRHQARVTIPAFAGELALLILVVVGTVVVAGADQRQQSIALARLRGSSAGHAARLLVREFGGLVVLSVVPGVLLAWAVCAAACRWWLGERAHPELRWPVLAAAAGVAVVYLLVVAGVGRRTAKRPVADLLRRVPLRVSRRGVGVLEAAVAAAAVAGVIVLRSGAHDNPLAVLTPGLIALVAGLVLSRLLGALAGLMGHGTLWRGRLALGLAGLQVARRPGVRRAVILLCVAAALIVSAVDQWSVSGRNRSARAQVEAGAPVVLTVHASSAAALAKAVSAADPRGRYATPVIRQAPASAPPVFAVDPEAFGQIAGWGWPSNRPPDDLLRQLDPPRPPPVSLSGTTVQLSMQDVTLTRGAALDKLPGTRGPVSLLIKATQANGTEVATRIGPLPEGHGRTATLTADLPCSAGCRLTQIGLLRTTSDADVITIDARLVGVSAGRAGAMHPVSLGPATDWAPATPDATTTDGIRQTIRLTPDGANLRLHIVNVSAPAVLQHLDLPIALPAVTAGGLGLNPDARGYLSAANIDGVDTSYTAVGATPLIPGAGGPGLLIDLRLAIRTATAGLQDSTTEVWLGHDSPARERALTAALARNGVTVLSRDSTARHAAALDATAPAWAMQLALVTAALAVLIAALVVVMSSTAARRSRVYDASAMALVGVRQATLRRVALVEQAVAALLAVLAGVFGAHLALPAIPIFVQNAEVPAVLLPIAWGRAAVATLAALVVLGTVSATVALALVRRLGLVQLRDDR